MSAHAPHADVKATGSGDCGCGCGGQCGCDSRCCDLECLVRPRFFCGQLLTDNDLGATVDWARQRFALSRYRDGWGVACGLDVSCTSPKGAHACCPDGETGPTVYLNPGYAVDCCGNDLVVCDPIAVDLGEVCRPLDDPCDRPPGWKPPRDGPAVPVDDTRKRTSDDCWDLASGDVVAVDLFLRYHEDLAQGQRAMLRGGCSDVGSCEYTRVRERPCVHAEIGAVAVRCDDDDSGWEDWLKELNERRIKMMKGIYEAMKNDLDGVLRYLRRHPPYRFCFLEEYVCCLQETGEDNPKRASALTSRIIFWLYFDWLLHELECACGSCRPDRGVPVGRVLLRRVENRGESKCRVMLIDTAAPYRRALKKDECRPIPRGGIDLAPYLWQPGRAAVDGLAMRGLRVRTEVLDEATIFGQLAQSVLALSGATLSDGQRNLKALLVRDPFKCDRVAAFVPDL